MAGMPATRLPIDLPLAPARRQRRRSTRVLAAVLAVLVAGSATGCVGRLGRNDDDVTPESDRPSANNAMRFDTSEQSATSP